ncbi:hypothetical protein HDU86_000127 [Geranomyces michiganensis]|nr:hypothetical protein HDU86_000127 [Geranomyces michiganensis]
MSSHTEPSAWVSYAATVLAVTSACILPAVIANALVFMWAWCGFADEFDDDADDDDDLDNEFAETSTNPGESRTASTVLTTTNTTPFPYTPTPVQTKLESQVTILESQLVEALRRISNLEKTSITITDIGARMDRKRRAVDPLPALMADVMQELHMKKPDVAAKTFDAPSGWSINDGTDNNDLNNANEEAQTPLDAVGNNDLKNVNEEAQTPQDVAASSLILFHNDGPLPASVVQDLSAGPLSLHPVIASAAEAAERE